MSALSKRVVKNPALAKRYPAAKAFHAKQRLA